MTSTTTMAAYRRLDRALDRLCRATAAPFDAGPDPLGAAARAAVADRLRDLLCGGAISIAGPHERPYPTELLRRIGAAYGRALGGWRWAAKRLGTHYTPGSIAERLVALVEELDPGHGWTLDPACGAGSLLLAWRDRRPEAPVEGWDVDPDGLSLAEALLELQARERGVTPAARFSGADLFSAVPAEARVVLVNPPWGTHVVGAARAFAERARWSPREPDTFALALECVRGWKDVDVVGAIVPDAIRMQPELATLRRGLSRDGWLQRLEPLGFGVFPGVTVRPCLVVGAPGRMQRPRVRVVGEAGPVERPLAVGADDLARWSVDDPRAQALWERCCRGAEPLGELCRCHEGIHTGNVRHKLWTDRAEEAGARPLLKGADIGRYRLQFRGRYVRYLPELVDRAAGEYASLRDPEIFEGPKLLSRQTSDHLVVCTDPGDYVTDNSLHTLRPRPGAPGLEWLALVLNSSLATALYRSQSGERDRPLPQIKLALLRRLPIRAPSGRSADATSLYGRASAEASHGGLGPATQAAIDALVFDSYGVPESDREWIRNDLGAVPRGRRRFAEEPE